MARITGALNLEYELYDFGVSVNIPVREHEQWLAYRIADPAVTLPLPIVCEQRFAPDRHSCVNCTEYTVHITSTGGSLRCQ